ncbi:MAG: UDP-N-acetylmuramoyl-L-alanyl-D-glutamate--2,6-diaminopimelate ligase [Anaerolineae bacterium]|jgi:UDP-N-acetylmuramoyl-L-alanyl-D-glutamate--2,6-diaminopimelate ligase|nr:UDP-N-acetylmuramoyl-L-alanyl-D-glutamate--2,6-diaminopimelate ligase [Anaerolineae bacterium]
MNNLMEIIANIPVPVNPDQSIHDLTINGITLDSREVKPGFIFAAVKGLSVDGHQFIPDAIKNGAVAILGEHSPETPYAVPYLSVKNAREALAYCAAALEDFPARKLTILGVTGTDGKTTTSTILYHILKTAGLKAGLITTVNAIIGDEEIDTGFHVTTPEAVDVQHYLRKMVDAGMTHVILETTSHGLAQYRVTGCEYDVAIVTNITHEHLDYHGSYEEYRAAKGRLFTELTSPHKHTTSFTPVAVLNKDDTGSYAYLHSITTAQQYAYAIEDEEADFFATGISHTPQGLSFSIKSIFGAVNIHTSLIGHYNISNILAAYSAAVGALGVAPAIAAQAIASVPGVAGRMEVINLGQDFSAIVDFAHTPNALKVALETLKTITQGNIWAVFGSAGLRDREKRALMGEVSAQYADFSVFTAEDPRTESLDEILTNMANAATAKGAVEHETFWRIRDRGAAIQFAVDHAKPGDIVCAFGKGHEQSMCFGTTEHPWDDRQAIKAALAKHLHIEGPPMPYLPTQELA